MGAPSNPYLATLTKRANAIQLQVETLMESCRTLPVGSGYIDVITRQEHHDQFISGLTAIGVAIHFITLWCDCTELNKSRYGCPHGYGGPIHATGYFSEVCERDSFDVEALGVDVWGPVDDQPSMISKCNGLATAYVTAGMKERRDYSPCFVPGFWLAVPKDWKRQTYLVRPDA
jgi:hypothetical protein